MPGTGSSETGSPPDRSASWKKYCEPAGLKRRPSGRIVVAMSAGSVPAYLIASRLAAVAVQWVRAGVGYPPSHTLHVVSCGRLSHAASAGQT